MSVCYFFDCRRENNAHSTLDPLCAGVHNLWAPVVPPEAETEPEYIQLSIYEERPQKDNPAQQMYF